MKKVLTVILSCTFTALAVACVFLCYQNAKTGLGNGTATRWNEEVENLAETISADCNTDKERIDSFYYWLIDNIEYDYGYNEFFQYFDAEKTLNTRKGLCYDYANLFAAFCRSQGIPCYVVDGYNRYDSLDRHTWNRVYYEGSWWNLDVTSDAISSRQGKTLYGFHPICSYDAEDEDYVITRIY